MIVGSITTYCGAKQSCANNHGVFGNKHTNIHHFVSICKMSKPDDEFLCSIATNKYIMQRWLFSEFGTPTLKQKRADNGEFDYLYQKLEEYPDWYLNIEF